MDKIPNVLKLLLVAAVLAIVVVVFHNQQDANERAGWEQYAKAQQQGFGIPALEAALDAARGTSAEPWITYQLAYKLYDQGGRESYDRARSIANEALKLFPAHPLADDFSHIASASESFLALPAPPAPTTPPETPAQAPAQVPAQTADSPASAGG